MVAGVVFLKWWTLEMSALFLASSILIAIVTGINEKVFTREFIKGAENLLNVAFIIGVARGVTVILNEGLVSDSILFYTASLVQGIQPALFIILLLLFYIVFSLFIQSTSGMAVLTMPIIGALAIIVNIPGREIVNSYMYGMSIMGFVAPTGLILPSLAMVNVSFKTWLKFVDHDNNYLHDSISDWHLPVNKCCSIKHNTIGISLIATIKWLYLKKILTIIKHGVK
jgi:uncharacterized ion transporter superfamily protein YfcC